MLRRPIVWSLTFGLRMVAVLVVIAAASGGLGGRRAKVNAIMFPAFFILATVTGNVSVKRRWGFKAVENPRDNPPQS